MHRVSDESVEEFKKVMEKEKGHKYETDEEARAAAQNLYDFVEFMYKLWREDEGRKARLKTEPKGFAIKGEGRACSLCKSGIGHDEDMWYDRWGMKCMDCQKALNRHLIPGYVFSDSKKEKHITASELSWELKVKHQTIKKLVRQRKLKARVVPGKQGETLVFLRKENPHLAQVVSEALK